MSFLRIVIIRILVAGWLLMFMFLAVLGALLAAVVAPVSYFQGAAKGALSGARRMAYKMETGHEYPDP